jgi:chromate transporter
MVRQDASVTGSEPDTQPARHLVPLGEATKAWFLISLQTFGGPAGQIAVMQRTLVDERRWIGERRFLHALSYCMLLPGPEAQQLAVYTGWLLNGWAGGLIAGVLFVLPGLVAMLALSWAYVTHGETAVVTGLFLGLAPAVVAIVVQAVVRIGGRALTHPALVVLAVCAFALLALLHVPFPVVILAAGAAGWLVNRRWPTGAREPPSGQQGSAGAAPLVPDDALHRASPSVRRNMAILVAGLALWVAPVALAFAMAGGSSVFTDQGVFFGGMALVSFGGAYAVLSYVTQAAVATYGWLSAGEMVRGLALAETTPGPLIMVVQFVAFLAAYRNPGDLDPLLAGLLGSLLTVWVTFVPSFLYIFLGAPYVERLRGNAALRSALDGVTAAIVGVIANLALFFAVHTFFSRTTKPAWGPVSVELPVWSSYVWEAWLVAVVAFVLVFALRWPILRILGACAILGIALSTVS